MTYLPELKVVNSPLQKQIIDFKGYSVAPIIEDGEMRDMLNLSSDQYPNLSQRGPRGPYTIGGIEVDYGEPEVICVKNGALAVITEGSEDEKNPPLFYYGCKRSGQGDWHPVQYPQIALQKGRHQMVSIGKRICIWPEKLWFDTTEEEDGTHLSGSLAETYTLDNSTITFENDTTTECVMTLPEGEDLSGFTVNDVVEIYFTDNEDNVYQASSTIRGVNGRVMVFPADAFLSILPEFPSSGEYTFTGTLFMQRPVPDLEFIMESGNRLWGCYDNKICCCKLGDPTNWHYYQGLSVDSFEVQVGTDGPWTGCVPYSSHLLFFKENYIHKVYGNTPATYQTQQSECYGLEKGSEKSICVINGTVFYKSKIGIMAYGGTLPEHISANFGNKVYTNAIAGTDGSKYYVNMKTTSGREQLVFDLDKALWHKENDMDPLMYVYLTNDTYNEEGKNQLLYLRSSDRKICSVSPYVPFEDEADGIEWMAELGPFDEYLENKKIYSKIKMRLKLDEGAELSISIKFDTGEWRVIRHIYQHDERTAYVPISPQRCDKFLLRLEGKGNCVVESVIREYRERSDR